jgi:hypothetical protein
MRVAASLVERPFHYTEHRRKVGERVFNHSHLHRMSLDRTISRFRYLPKFFSVEND